MNRKYDNRTLWNCTRYKQTLCKSRLTTFGKTVNIRGEHNHPTSYPDKSEAVPQQVTLVYDSKNQKYD